ncbi:C6 transcription factor [Penicillium cf. viridicatum]|uniref:C6 transcription factor n=1 Tax=Penicillium cf. viridicatum TaxID=2972119 RepID=A0A9W9MKJ9_9EURO|nr:C6 transcription factor [Penicillium cf. viridicatum]
MTLILRVIQIEATQVDRDKATPSGISYLRRLPFLIRSRTLVGNNNHLRNVLLRSTQIQGTRPHRTWLRFTRIKDMFPTVCVHCRGRTILTHLPKLKHRKEPTKEQLRDGERPSLVGTVGAIRCSGSETSADGRCRNCLKSDQDCLFIPVSSPTQAYVPAHAVYPHLRTGLNGYAAPGPEGPEGCRGPPIPCGTHRQPLAPQQQKPQNPEIILPSPQGPQGM